MKTKEPKDKSITPVTPNRKTTSVYVDSELWKEFIESCHYIQRKTCDIIEPMARAFIIAVNKLKDNPDSDFMLCPLKPSMVKIDIESINLETIYNTRGRKPNVNMVFCERGNKYGSKSWCLHKCMFGGNLNTYKPIGHCDVYQKLRNPI